MAHVYEERVRETSSTTGTDDWDLAGAVTNFRDFASVMENGDTCHVCATREAGGWEVAKVTFNEGVLERPATVIAGSNGTSRVNFGGGPKDIYLIFVADDVVTLEKLGAIIAGLTGKTALVDGDRLLLSDSEDSDKPKKVTWANIKTALITAFKASASGFWAAVSDITFLTPKTIADAGALISIASATTINTDGEDGQNFMVTLDHNATFAAPTHLIDGKVYTWLIKQGSTGGTGAFNAMFVFPSAPTLSTGAGKYDIVSAIYCAADTKLIARFSKGS
jgi:hypothetical protein